MAEKRRRRPNITDGPNPEAARHALRTCLEGPPAKMGPDGHCLACGYGTSVSEQIRFNLDCEALEKVATEEDRIFLERALRKKRRKR